MGGIGQSVSIILVICLIIRLDKGRSPSLKFQDCIINSCGNLNIIISRFTNYNIEYTYKLIGSIGKYVYIFQNKDRRVGTILI